VTANAALSGVLTQAQATLLELTTVELHRQLVRRLDDGELDRETAAALVPRLWIRAGSGGRPLTLAGEDGWRRLWSASGYTVEGRPARRPEEPVLLYRGAPPHNARGWCWSDDPRVAMTFATRHGTIRREYATARNLWATLAPPEALCARHCLVRSQLGATLAEEWVVDSARLDSVRPWTGVEIEATPDPSARDRRGNVGFRHSYEDQQREAVELLRRRQRLEDAHERAEKLLARKTRTGRRRPGLSQAAYLEYRAEVQRRAAASEEP
jgi:hypothetical protein